MTVFAFAGQDVIEQIGTYAGLAAVPGLAVLALLFFAQAKEVRRLREWAGRAPERDAELQERAVVAAEAARLRTAAPARPVPQRGAQPTGRVGAGPPRPAGAPAGTPKPAASATPDATPKPATPAAVGGAAAKPATPGAPGQAPSPVPAGAAAAATAAGSPAPAAAGGANAATPPAEAEAKGSGDDETAVVPAPATAAAARPPADPPTALIDEQDTGEDTGDLLPPLPPAAGPPRPAPRGVPPRPGQARAAAALRQQRPSAAPRRPADGPARQAGGDRDSGRSRRPLLLVAGALVLVLGVVLAVTVLGGGDEEPIKPNTFAQPTPAPEPEAPERTTTAAQPVTRGDVTVAVLNGTTVPGLAATVADQVEEDGFLRGTTDDNDDQQLQATVVHYAPGQEAAAREVAKLLDASKVSAATASTQALAGDADVVVVLGADRTP